MRQQGKYNYAENTTITIRIHLGYRRQSFQLLNLHRHISTNPVTKVQWKKTTTIIIIIIKNDYRIRFLQAKFTWVLTDDHNELLLPSTVEFAVEIQQSGSAI